MKNAFGDLLRHLREDKEMSVRAVADQIGMSAGFLSQLENGRVIPSKERVLKIAKFFGHRDELLYAAGHTPTDIFKVLRSKPNISDIVRALGTLDSAEVRKVQRAVEKLKA